MQWYNDGYLLQAGEMEAEVFRSNRGKKFGLEFASKMYEWGDEGTVAEGLVGCDKSIYRATRI